MGGYCTVTDVKSRKRRPVLVHFRRRMFSVRDIKSLAAQPNQTSLEARFVRPYPVDCTVDRCRSVGPESAFPHYAHSPTSLSEQFDLATITLDILSELFRPKVCVRSWN